MSPRRISDLDPNFIAKAASGKLRWHDLRPLGLEGQGWTDVAHPYDRLPKKAQDCVRDAVWTLGCNSSGLCVRFVTTARQLAARWTVQYPEMAMPHMAATGVSGLDLYVRRGRSWHWLSQGRPDKLTTRVSLVSALPPGRREFLLYLPLYNCLESVYLGLAPGVALEPAPRRRGRTARPICFYGTSITQGGCASRPGMTYPAILGRRLNRPVINLGFSGNGEAEPEMADLLAELDPGVFVIDCLPNLKLEQIEPRVGHLVRVLRAARPRCPIVLVEHLRIPSESFLPHERRLWHGKNQALQQLFRELRREGLTGLHLAPGDLLLGQDGEATVDGIHPTDLGFMRMANALEPVLRPLI